MEPTETVKTEVTNEPNETTVSPEAKETTEAQEVAVAASEVVTPETPEKTEQPKKESAAASESDSETSLTERVVPNPEGYALPEGVPDEVRKFAFDNDFTQEQLNKTLEQFGGYLTAGKQAEHESLRVLGEAHVKNWGDQSTYNLSLAKRALTQNDTDGALAKALNESGYGNHPAVLDFLFNLGKGMQEGGFLKGNINRSKGKKSMAQKMFPEMTSVEN